MPLNKETKPKKFIYISQDREQKKILRDSSIKMYIWMYN